MDLFIVAIGSGNFQMVHTLYETSRYENKNFYGLKFQQRQILNGQSLHVEAVMK